jgi:hypothetical protein
MFAARTFNDVAAPLWQALVMTLVVMLSSLLL